MKYKTTIVNEEDYTEENVTSQIKSTPLSQLWLLLGANSQVEAVEKIKKLTNKILAQRANIGTCPFLSTGYKLNIDIPCPICGDLGDTKEQDSNCSTLRFNR